MGTLITYQVNKRLSVTTRIKQAGGGSSGCRRRKLTLAQKWVVVLSFLVLALGLANLGRAGVALRYDALLPDMPLTVPLTYLAVMGGFWGVALTICAVGLLYFHPWGRWSTLAAVTLYEAHIWVNHLLFDASDFARQTLPRDVALTLLLLALIWGSLSLRSVKKTFERKK